MPEVYATVPQPVINERVSFTATAYFRDGDSEQASTTAKYRIDCLTTGTTVVDWTSLTPAASIAISVKSADNRIIGGNKTEKKQITVSSDPGETTETRSVKTWKVKNIRGFEG